MAKDPANVATGRQGGKGTWQGDGNKLKERGKGMARNPTNVATGGQGNQGTRQGKAKTEGNVAKRWQGIQRTWQLDGDGARERGKGTVKN